MQEARGLQTYVGLDFVLARIGLDPGFEERRLAAPWWTLAARRRGSCDRRRNSFQFFFLICLFGGARC